MERRLRGVRGKEALRVTGIRELGGVGGCRYKICRNKEVRGERGLILTRIYEEMI